MALLQMADRHNIVPAHSAMFMVSNAVEYLNTCKKGHGLPRASWLPKAHTIERTATNENNWFWQICSAVIWKHCPNGKEEIILFCRYGQREPMIPYHPIIASLQPAPPASIIFECPASLMNWGMMDGALAMALIITDILGCQIYHQY